MVVVLVQIWSCSVQTLRQLFVRMCLSHIHGKFGSCCHLISVLRCIKTYLFQCRIGENACVYSVHNRKRLDFRAMSRSDVLDFKAITKHVFLTARHEVRPAAIIAALTIRGWPVGCVATRSNSASLSNPAASAPGATLMKYSTYCRVRLYD